MSHCCSYILQQIQLHSRVFKARDALTVFGVLLQKEVCHVQYEKGEGWEVLDKGERGESKG